MHFSWNKIRPFLKSPAFRRLVITSLLAFCLPVTLIFLYFTGAQTATLEEEVYHLRSNIVSRLAGDLENETRRFHSFASILQSNDTVREVEQTSYEEMTVAQRLRIKKLCAALASYTSLSDYAGRCVLYFSKADLVVDFQRSLRLSEYTEISADLLCFPEDPQLWESLVGTRTSGQWVQGTTIHGEPTLYYVQTLSGFSVKDDYCNLIVMLSPSSLSSWLKAEEGTCLMLLKQDGTVLYEDNCLESVVPLKLTEETLTPTQQVRNDVLYSSAAAEASGCILLEITPLHQISGSVSTARRMFAGVFVLCMLALITLTFLISAYHYRPIGQLVGLLSQNDEDGKDEFELLRRELIQSAENREKLLESAQLQKLFADDAQFLERLETPQIENHLMNRLKGIWDGAMPLYWCTLVVHPFDYSAQEEEFLRLLVNIRDVVVSFVSPSYCVVPILRSGSVVALCGFSSQDSSQLAVLSAIMKGALEYVRDQYATECNVRISGLYEGQKDWKTYFHRMQDDITLLKSLQNGNENVAVFDDNAELRLRQVSAEQTARRLLTASAIGERDEVDHLLEKLRNQILGSSEEKKEKEEEREDEEAVRTGTPLRDNRLKEQITEIVGNEYPNPMLNVSYIADRLGRNVDRVSRSFKAVAGIGLLDYIHHTRIEAACRLLKQETELPVNTVSQRVGYASVDSFNRAFKRIMGMTAGKYREVLWENRVESSNENKQGL